MCIHFGEVNGRHKLNVLPKTSNVNSVPMIMREKTRVKTQWTLDPGGGTQVWVSCGRAGAKFESRSIEMPIFQQKVTHSYI